MRFIVTHTTGYKYQQPASESFAELRVWPKDTPTQEVLHRKLTITPNVPVDSYVDYFGNRVEFFSVPFRHNALSVSATAEVQTFPGPDLTEFMLLPLGEVRQIFNSQMYRLFDFLQPTEKVPLSGLDLPDGRLFFREANSIGDCLIRLNAWIFENYSYTPGATEVSTSLPEIIKQRKGVCQDFAHLMLAILRSNRLPARYVSGYIEAYDPETPQSKLTGAAASHAWVEVFLPGGHSLGLDPTNNQTVGERHVKVAAGRDYDDVAPMRGTFKGAQDQRLQVIVSLKRKEPANNEVSLQEGV